MLLSIGDQVKPGTYRLHSVFKRAVNFERRGRLVSVVDESIGPGPLNIVLRNLTPAPAKRCGGTASSIPEGLHRSARGWIAVSRRGDPTLGDRLRNVPNPERVGSRLSLDQPSLLRISHSAVCFEGHRYHFSPRHRYNSTLALRQVDSRRFQRNLSLLRAALRRHAPPKSLAFLLDNNRRRRFRTGFERAYAEQMTRGAGQVFHGNLLPGIRQLRGCGLGLTPGGDDFIAGLLIGLHVFEKLRGQDLKATREAIFRAARGNNIFSNTFLDLARRGLLLGRIKDLLLALDSTRQASMRKAARELFAVGETSGADLATGLLMTLDSRLRSIDQPRGCSGQEPRLSS